MKILVLSLLRLGDVMMMSPTLRRLKDAAPQCELHVMINKECRVICPLMPWVDRWLEFDRQGYQKALGDPETSLIDGFTELRSLVEELRAQNYSSVLNLTHTRLSGWLAGALEVPVQAGLTLTAPQQASIASNWFRYLNEHPLKASITRFHTVDIYHAGAGFDHSWHLLQLQETERGQQEAAQVIPQSPFILVQPLTSDAKKNWSLEKWAQTLRYFAIFHPQHQIVLLGAPFEKAQIDQLSQLLRELRVPATQALVSLDGALSLCHKASLLITGDTSIKHLASATSCRIAEISIGSSQLFATGVYSPDNLIIQAVTPCAPCPHSEACSQSSHACSEQLSAELVALAASKLMQQDFSQLKIVAEQFRDQATLYRTEWNETGLWHALPISPAFTRQNVRAWVERTSWQILLSNQTTGIDISAERLQQILIHLYPTRSRDDWKFVFADLKTEMEKSLDHSTSSLKKYEFEIVCKILSEMGR